MSDELQRADEWIKARCAADVSLTGIVAARLYSSVVPDTGSFPCVLFGYLGGFDARGTGTIRILHSGLWLIRAVADTRDWGGQLGLATDRLDAIFDRAPSGLVGADATVFTATRDQPYREIEPLTGGGERRHAGGIYRLLIQRS